MPEKRGAAEGGPESRQPVDQTRVWLRPAWRRSAPWTAVLAAVILGASGYGLHAGWLPSVGGHSPRHRVTDSAGTTPDRQPAESPKPAIEDPGSRRDAELPIALPRQEEPGRLADDDRRRPGAPALSRPAQVKVAKPEGGVSRERPKPRAPQIEKEGDDPAAIIDWLLRESGKR